MMLNADSSDEKSESELQRSATAPTTESVVAFRCTASTTLTIDSTDWSGKTSSRYDDERARRVGLVEEPEHGQREEDERHERREREVRDHRREVRPSLAEEAVERRSDGPHGGSLLASGAGMDASAALSELVGLSTQVVEAVITGPDGEVEAARTAGDERSRALAAHGAELLAAASAIRADGAGRRARARRPRPRLARRGVLDGERTVVATTVAEPTVGLVAYDLRAVLARLRERRVVRLLLAARAGGLGAWLVLRRRGADERRVVVAWEDGSELELGAGLPERERLVAVARGALR